MFISVYDSDLEKYVSINADKIQMYYGSKGNNYNSEIIDDKGEIIVRSSFTKKEIDEILNTKHYMLKVNDYE